MKRNGRARWSWICVVLVIVAVLALAVRLRESVPMYQGKSVYDWMFETRSSALEQNEGLTAIGTNAVSYLAGALATRNTPYDRSRWVRNRRAQVMIKLLRLGRGWTTSSEEFRRAATWSLFAFGVEARPALAQLHAELLNPDAAHRQMVSLCISEIGPLPESIPFLVQAWPLAAKEPYVVRHTLMHTLGHGGTNAAALAMPIALAALDDVEPEVRHVAANALERWAQPAPAAIPRLVAMLSDTNEHLAGAAAAALGRITNSAPEATSALRQLLTSSNEYTRAMAAATLWRLGGDAEETRNVLEGLLMTKDGRGIAARELGNMGDLARTSVPVLLRASHLDMRAWVDMYDRALCATAVLKILGESAEALGVLEEALVTETNGWIRATVAKDMGRLGRPAVPLIPALRRALQDDDRNVRYEAGNALAKLQGLK